MNSVTSCWMNLKLGLPPRCTMLSTEPVTKLSRPMTLWPRDRSRSVRCEPRKPAAPVTTEVGCLADDLVWLRGGIGGKNGGMAGENCGFAPGVFLLPPVRRTPATILSAKIYEQPKRPACICFLVLHAHP